ncbi:MAG: ribosome silencing factor [Anaerolineales bacterium]|nr:ribosome silencing factor [Anaerolineales bacterium]
MVDTLEEKKAEDIVLLDLRGQLVFTDYFVICTGTSERQLTALAEAVDEAARHKFRLKRPRVEGHAAGGWLLMDFGSVIVHAFSQAQRHRYKLEELWQAGKVVLRIQ